MRMAVAGLMQTSCNWVSTKPTIQKTHQLQSKRVIRVNTCRTSAGLQECRTQSNSSGQSATLAQVPKHLVTVLDRQSGTVHKFWVPEDQYILHTAEDQDITLPFACRHGCCTTCAVRVKSGVLRQPEALGISPELKSKGYALLCVGFPSSDLEVETQDEDEVYWLQFGRYFARGPIDRDDYALELAMGDE
uniref:2Fe-2S ferredoxin-type domain-containing protein n=1 Tax=Picea sitchensis TaxID=3332 RepID=A9NPD5_PICSI|nr:unknown [Picea sitchensis]